MSSIDQPISYVVDSTLLESRVDIDDQKEDTVSQKHTRPWLTMCLAASERLFHSLALFLSTYSSRSVTLFQVESICAQWTKLHFQPLYDQQKPNFLEYCRTRWQISPVSPRELDLLLSSDL